MGLFEENFWGEKYAGFDVLYNNMKHCRNANQVFGDFLKEISVAEDTFAKALMKVAKNYANHNALGTFQPVFNYIRKSTENVSNLYQEDARKMQDLIKDIIKCGETLKEKYKLAKDSVANTADDVQTLQILSANIYKARDIYHGRESEVERLRRENATTKDIDKMLSKAKKASDDYKNALDKFPPARKNFITKFTKSCGVFHSHETFHLERMATLVKKFVELQSYFTSVVQKENDRLTKELTSMRTENLLQIFVDSKGTGNDIPVDIPFESYKDKPHEDSVHDYNRSHSKEPTKDDSKSHLFKLNFKTKKKKVDRDSTNDNLSNSANDQDEVTTPAPVVDEEGYSIRPDDIFDRGAIQKATVQDSDSSSDDEDDKKKIHVKIKPVSGGQTKSQVSVDQLRAIGSSLSLSSGVRAVKSPGGSAACSTNSTPVSEKRNLSNLLMLDEDDTDNSPSLLAGTKIGLPKRKSVDSTAKIEISPPGDVKKATILNSVSSPSENPPPLPPKAKDRNSINGPLFIAGPTSPTLDKLPPPLMASNVRSSTISITPPGTIQSIPRSTSDDRGPRNEGSSPSLSLKTLSTAISATRSASMPARTEKSAIIAVALTEVVNACFKPDDSCLVKITGEMKISFPTQSLKLFHDNPNYPALKLRLTGSKNLEQVALNNLFVTSSSQLTDADYRIDFKMSDLVTHLSQQSEQSSMYHNVDVLKYQVKSDGPKSTPLKLRGEWKCEPQSTDVSIEYTYNADALSSAIPLANVNFIAPVDGGVTNYQMNQEATWNKELDRALWKLTRIENSNSGSKIEGHFDLSSGPTKSKRVAVKFSCPGSTLSGLDISLADVKGYKISFVKKQITAGKYFVDGE